MTPARLPGQPSDLRDAGRHDVTQKEIEPGPPLERRPGSMTRIPDAGWPADVGALHGVPRRTGAMLPTPAPKTPTIDRSACPSVRGHGTRHHRYVNGCICPDGLAEHNRYCRQSRAGIRASSLVDAVGSRRRLQALAVIGYGAPWLAGYLGTSRPHVQRIRNGGVRSVQEHVAEMIRVAFERLESAPQADGPGLRASRQAIARGWVGPDQWGDIDDPTEMHVGDIDERFDDVYRREPQHAVATVDLLELAMHMRVDGRPDHDAIAARVGMTAEAVQKRLERRAGGATRLTADQVYAIRDEYLRTRHDGWNGKATAKRNGVSTFVVSTIIHGTTRPELGLTDLTVQQGDHTPAAPPTGREKKRGAAA